MQNRLNIAYLGDGYSCDSIIESGFYEITKATDAPEADSDWLVVMFRSPRASKGDLEAVQVAYSKASGAQWTRSSDGSTWSDWSAAGSGGTGFAFDETNADALLGTIAAPYNTIYGDLGKLYQTTYGAAMPDTTQGKLDALVAMAIKGLLLDLRVPVGSHLAGTDPTVNDDAANGFATYTLWVNSSTQDVFINVSNQAGAAVWKKFTFAA